MTVRCTDGFVKPHRQVSQRLTTVFMHGTHLVVGVDTHLDTQTAAWTAPGFPEALMCPGFPGVTGTVQGPAPNTRYPAAEWSPGSAASCPAGKITGGGCGRASS